MKPNELLGLLECIGPLSLSEEFCKKCGAYDNSGLLVDCGEEITGVLFSLDLSENSLNEAKRRGYNAIVTHHPAIYGGVDRISTADKHTSLVAECLRWGISVISMHLNFDAAPEGIDYRMMLGLGGEAADTMIKLGGGAYGRVYDIKKTALGGYVANIKKTFSTQRVIVYGEEDRQIRRVASFCGAGCDDEAIEFAVSGGADAFVSSDFKHHQITSLIARGISVIALTHYAAENYGFYGIYQKFIEGLNVPSAYFADAALM